MLKVQITNHFISYMDMNESTALRTACIYIHELFNELISVGMKREDALTLLAKVLREGQQGEFDGENYTDKTATD